MKLLACCLALGLIASATTAASAGRAAKSARSLKGAPASEAFESLKKLVGVWDADMDADGKTDATVRYELTGAGSVLQETLFEGSDHEMVTMYHLNNDELWLTHYCAAGNQPRMQATVSADGKSITFDFVDGTNIDESHAGHMQRVIFSFINQNHHTEEWHFAMPGSEMVEKFDLRRKS